MCCVQRHPLDPKPFSSASYSHLSFLLQIYFIERMLFRDRVYSFDWDNIFFISGIVLP